MCDQVPCESVFKAVFLIAFFGFLRISNIAPDSASSFDSSRNFTPSDVTISNKFMKITLKWTQTIQSRDKIHVVSLLRLQGSILWPVAALQKATSLYKPSAHAPLFPIKVNGLWKVLIDSRICTTKYYQD